MNVRLSVCIPALYSKIPAAEGIRLAAAQGARNVKIWSWWDQNLVAIQQALSETRCKMAAVCTRFVSLTDEKCLDAYLEGLRETIRVCQRFNCKRIITQVGNEIPDIPRERQHTQLIKGLKAASTLSGQLKWNEFLYYIDIPF